MSTAAAKRTEPSMTADEQQLRQDWEVFGRPDGYEGPVPQEQDDLDDPRHRKRGEQTRRKRLKRNRQQLEPRGAAA